MTEAAIFNIQRFSIHDGPGIRSTVFIKGCNLRCFWCHNPESQRMERELQYFPEKCIGCGNCVTVCPVGAHSLNEDGHSFDRDPCTQCGACADVCYPHALTMSGRMRTPQEVARDVERDRDYYAESGGGVTYSGGEPLLSHNFLRECLELNRAAGIHTAVDTALDVPWQTIESVMSHVDLFLVDFKHIDDDAHLAGTAHGNRRILENIARLRREHPRVWLRIPVIPGFNADEAVLARMAEYVRAEGPFERVDLLAFHRLSAQKYRSLGRTYDAANLEPPGAQEMERYRELFAAGAS